MTEREIIEFAAGLPDVTAVTASKQSGAPEMAWGDTFIFRGEQRKLPFATVVTHDYGDFDAFSQLDRPGVFRLSIGVGRARFAELIGYAPAAHAHHAPSHDYTELDRL